MGKTLRNSTESKHEPLLARLMKWRPMSLSEQAERLNDGPGVKRDARQPFSSLKRYSPTFASLRHRAAGVGPRALVAFDLISAAPDELRAWWASFH
jgi:hypothetical protein